MRLRLVVPFDDDPIHQFMQLVSGSADDARLGQSGGEIVHDVPVEVRQVLGQLDIGRDDLVAGDPEAREIRLYRKRCLRPTRDQLDVVKFQGISSSILLAG